MVTLDTLRRQKRASIVELGEKYGARNIRVFGSVARGESRNTSDVDFLVDFEKGRTLFDVIRLRLDLGELLGAEVEIVTPGSLHYMRDRVLAEAIPI